MYFGRDELLLPVLSYEASCGVGSIYNLAPRCFKAIAENYFSGQREGALTFATEVNHFIESLKEVGVIPAGKFLLAELGIGCGSARLPNRTLSESECELVLEAACKVPLDGEIWRSNKKVAAPHLDFAGLTSRKAKAFS